jgi:hypothetical protein
MPDIKRRRTVKKQRILITCGFNSQIKLFSTRYASLFEQNFKKVLTNVPDYRHILIPALVAISGLLRIFAMLMRDVIWTVIIVWLVYRLVEFFRGAGQKKTVSNSEPQRGNAVNQEQVRSAVKKSADREGEYIDFEEIK